MIAFDIAAPMAYPNSYPSAQVDSYHGTSVADPYRWLEEYTPQTNTWIEQQNALSSKYLQALPQRAKLIEELTKRWDYPKIGAPWKERGLYFHYENTGLQNQSVLYVQEKLDGPQRVLLDPNTLSADGTVALAGLSLSDDAKLMAYGTSSAGSDWVRVHVRDVATGKDLDDRLDWVKFSGMSWTLDGKGFFYSRFPEPKQGGETFIAANLDHKIYYHALGTKQESDKLIYERPDQPEWRMSARVSEDGRLLFISVGQSGPNNRLFVAELGDPLKPNVTAPLKPLIDNFESSTNVINSEGNTVWLQTDLNAPRGRVVAMDIARPEPEAWRDVIAQGADTLEGVSLVGDTFIARYGHNAHSKVLFYTLDGKPSGELKLPGLGTVSGPGGKRRADELFYEFTSFLKPGTVYRFDPKSRASTWVRDSAAKFDAEPYESRQVWFESKDGTRVPMFLTHRKGLKLDGSNPVLLYGYGGFGISLKPGFSISRTVWLEAGGVLAIPNLRGGGEFGQEWHDAGTKLRKQNVFDDFIGAAEYLIKEKVTSPGKIAISGGSNGGLLVGAVLNQRPELFGAALPAVGVMDMLRFQRFTIGSAWVYDYGSSDDKDQFAALVKYSPLHTTKKGASYPPTLVTTADHDDRVVPAHSFKYAAALQAAQGGSAPVLIRIETKAGHGAGKPTSKVIEEEADKWAFVMQALGVEYK